MRITVSLLALALSVSPAIARKGHDDAPKDPMQKKVCRESAETGTILPRRICKTRAEWAEIDKLNGANAERALENRRNLPQ
ncbi:MAG: hypothetical protein IPN84_01920 [Sphingomonadales bacterium]|nr:hypothetical protein [Sphingomonadales bacterium]